MPKFRHRDFGFEVPAAWWIEAGMPDFVAHGVSFAAGTPERSGRLVMVAVEDMEATRRQLSHGVFNDGEEFTAEERVLRILKGFRDGDLIPPVEVIRLPAGEKYGYRLYHGAHRFYCAIAAGFTEVPAVEVGVLEVDDAHGGG